MDEKTCNTRKTNIVSIRFPDDVLQLVDTIAARAGRSRTEVVLTLIRLKGAEVLALQARQAAAQQVEYGAQRPA